MKDVTILVQGALHHHAINKFPTYEKVGKVIFSTWAGSNISELGDYKDRCQCVTSVLPQIYYYNFQNIFFQTLTTMNGLNAVNTEYVVKTRCDEYFTGIDKFVDVMIKNPDHIVFSNIFFRPDWLCKFHASDHLFGGKTDILRKAFNNLYKELLIKTVVDQTAECLITKHILMAKGVDLNLDNSRQIMKDNFKIVRLSEMDDITVMWNSTNKFFRSEHSLHNADTISQISFIEDV